MIKSWLESVFRGRETYPSKFTGIFSPLSQLTLTALPEGEPIINFAERTKSLALWERWCRKATERANIANT